MSKHTFDIMVAFAGIQTKEGHPFIDCIEAIREDVALYGFTVILENGMSLSGGYLARFTLNPYRNPRYHQSHTFNNTPENVSLTTIGTPEYWQEFREAVKEVAKIYEFC